jgi:hypothetical protein
MTPSPSGNAMRGMTILSTNTVCLSKVPSPLVSSWREIRLMGARELDPSASCMYERISRTYIRPLPSKVTPTGSSISGSVSTCSIL